MNTLVDVSVLPPSRNAPCPCGSGRRFKQCCGAAAIVSAPSGDSEGRPAEAAEAVFAQAFAAHQAGQLDEAAAGYQRALAITPNHAAALHYLGVSHYQRGGPQLALSLLEQALAIDAELPMLHSNLGLVYRELGRGEQAQACFDRAIELDGSNLVAFNNRGLQRLDGLQIEAAVSDFEHVTAQQPAFVEAHVNLAKARLAQRAYLQALEACKRALRLNDQLALVHALRGSALRELGRHDEALASWQRALLIEPGMIGAECDRGGLLQTLHRHQEAAEAFARAFAQRPAEPYLAGDLLHNRMHCCDWHDFGELCTLIRDGVEHDQRVTVPFQLMMVDSTAAQLQQCARILSRDRFPVAGIAAEGAQRGVHGRIRVVFMSADFRNHPTAHLIAGVLEGFDRTAFELIAVYLGPARVAEGDLWTARLRGAFEHFVDIQDASDQQLAERLRGMDADILVDLMGHTALARTGVLAQRPAPIQVNYLGFPGTMGSSFIDYLIADATLVPPSLRPCFDERIVYLPGSYQPNDDRKLVAAAPSRAQCGLGDDAFVFCCFNGNFKITPDVFDCWMRLLQRIDGSVLWLLAGDPDATRNLRHEAALRGIDSDRLVFAPRQPLAEHLARQALADLFLDTFHCNAHTTASDALWAGLPVLTCAGATLPGRVAASLLTAVGLPELITRSAAEYEALAVALALTPARLAGLRTKLARQRHTEPLFDTASYARHLEHAFKHMHERSLAGLAPADFVVPA